MSTISTRHFPYQHDDVAFDGVLVTGDGWDTAADRPAVLVFHGIEGRSDAQVDFARDLAAAGYLGVAVDLFGTAATAAGPERRAALLAALMQDRAALHQRLLRVYDVVRSLPEVDEDRVAAAGFCFGGLCVLDLARSGADVRGVASFHGVLTPPDDTAGTITSKVIVFHGWDDPYAPPDDVTRLGRELTKRGADWQIHAYGHAMHAFMAPTADNPAAGVKYDATAARRAWISFLAFLAEVFPGSDTASG